MVFCAARTPDRLFTPGQSSNAYARTGAGVSAAQGSIVSGRNGAPE